MTSLRYETNRQCWRTGSKSVNGRRVCYSLRPSPGGVRTVQGAANPCSFGLSPEFSTPVEKPVENRPNERLGADSRPYRNKGEPPLLLHVVPAHVVHRRGPQLDRRPGSERRLHGLAHQALLGRDGGGDGGSETSERHRPVRSRFER